jgi:hypothetical protein
MSRIKQGERNGLKRRRFGRLDVDHLRFSLLEYDGRGPRAVSQPRWTPSLDRILTYLPDRRRVLTPALAHPIRLEALLPRLPRRAGREAHLSSPAALKRIIRPATILRFDPTAAASESWTRLAPIARQRPLACPRSLHARLLLRGAARLPFSTQAPIVFFLKVRPGALAIGHLLVLGD